MSSVKPFDDKAYGVMWNIPGQDPVKIHLWHRSTASTWEKGLDVKYLLPLEESSNKQNSLTDEKGAKHR
jgi:hypothetical protein